MNATVDLERFKTITALYRGAHKPDSHMCVMEAVAYVAHERWSAQPVCACPVISAFLRAWNDALPDADRTRLLLPLVLKLVGSRASSRGQEERRRMLALDWLIRTYAPAWLRLVGLDSHADALTRLPELMVASSIPHHTGRAINAARDAAGAAAGAAGDAAWAVAWAAAGAAAAQKRLQPTVKLLQQSALELIERMLAA